MQWCEGPFEQWTADRIEGDVWPAATKNFLQPLALRLRVGTDLRCSSVPDRELALGLARTNRNDPRAE